MFPLQSFSLGLCLQERLLDPAFCIHRRFQHNLQPHSTVFVLDNLEGDCVPRRTLPKWVSVSLRAEALSPQNPASGSGHGAGCGRAGGQGWCPPAHFPPSLHPASSLPVPPNRSVGEASPGDLLLPGLLWLSLWTAPLPSDSSSWDGGAPAPHGICAGSGVSPPAP